MNEVPSRTCYIFANWLPQIQKIIQNIKNFGSVRAGVLKTKPAINNENTDISILWFFGGTSKNAYYARSTRIRNNNYQFKEFYENTTYAHFLVQHFKETDSPRRVEFSEFIFTSVTRKCVFLGNINWNEFVENGDLHRCNSHYWSDTNVHRFKSKIFKSSGNPMFIVLEEIAPYLREVSTNTI